MHKTLSILAVVGLLGCSPTLDFQQCRDNDDCRNLEEVPLVCLANTCQMQPDPNDTPCETHEDCVATFDEMHVCGPQAMCTSLVSDECQELLRPEDVSADEIVYFGSIMAVSPPFDDAIQPIENAVLLATEDFNEVASLDGGKKVGWVGCDSAGSANTAQTAAEHLVNNVGVQAIVGPTFSEEVIEVAEDVTVQNDVFLITPTASAKSISNLQDDDLVWRTISSDIYQAVAIGDRMGVMDPAPQRVLVLAKQDLYGQLLLEDALARIGGVLPDAAVGTLFYPDPADFDDPDELAGEYGLVIATGLEQNADTVVIIGTSEARDVILAYLLAIEGREGGPPRFLVSHGAVPALQDVVEAVASEFRPVLMPKLEGVTPLVQHPGPENTFEPFNVRYRVRFSDLDTLSASALGYDAAMVTLLAMSSINDDELDGKEISRAMAKLVDPSGVAVPFTDGLNFIGTAVDALKGGGSVDLVGVSGTLDFDLNLGEVRTDLLGWDVVPRAGTTDVPELVPTRRYVLDPAQPTGAWEDL